MHEVITLQFGQQANYLGTHYWNTQESYFTYAGEDESPVDHDVSFRPGRGVDGSETYTPRTLVYDLKGAFGTLRRENALYHLQRQENQDPWTGTTVPLHLPPIAPSPYQQALDSGSELPPLTPQTVRFWSDYNHIFYHPRSIIQLNEYDLNSSLMPFERWSSGEELFANLDREHDLLDRDLRPFLEECDQLQGVQIFSSADDAWGGFTAKYLERIADELGKGCRWVFGLQDTQRSAREQQTLRLANAAQSLYAFDSFASMHIPLGNVPSVLPAYTSLDGSSRWLTSALQAAAVESVTLPTRLRDTESAQSTFDSLEMILNGDGKRRIAACAMSVDDREARATETPQLDGQHDTRMTNGYTAEDHNSDDANPRLDIDFFPSLSAVSSSARRQSNHRPQLFSKMSSLRGNWLSVTEDDHADSTLRRRIEASGPRTSVYHSSLLFPILASYPRIFSFERRPGKLTIEASLSTSSAIANRVRSVEGIARRMMGIEEREALCDGLAGMADEYNEGWMSDESDDDDEDA